jgi:hypothetical protein
MPSLLRAEVCDGALAGAGVVRSCREDALAFGDPALTYRANLMSPRWG